MVLSVLARDEHPNYNLGGYSLPWVRGGHHLQAPMFPQDFNSSEQAALCYFGNKHFWIWKDQFVAASPLSCVPDFPRMSVL